MNPKEDVVTNQPQPYAAPPQPAYGAPQQYQMGPPGPQQQHYMGPPGPQQQYYMGQPGPQQQYHMGPPGPQPVGNN